MKTSHSGYFKLIMGPMYAGKSTELLRNIHKVKVLNKKMIVINHSFNNRYGSIHITTHDNKEFSDCIVLTYLSDLEKNYSELFSEADVIFIEELQFFQDAFENITKWIDIDKKDVIAAGLNGDFLRNPFGDILRLIPYADKVIQLNALCKKCGDGTGAHFTKRTIKNTETTIVGSDDIYEAVCRKHYLES